MLTQIGQSEAPNNQQQIKEVGGDIRQTENEKQK
jgi:hypothetical protein